MLASFDNDFIINLAYITGSNLTYSPFEMCIIAWDALSSLTIKSPNRATIHLIRVSFYIFLRNLKCSQSYEPSRK